jgi:hypothetical protein
MSERSDYAPGTPCWVDLGSPDLDASIEFYGSLFGWDVPESASSEATGGYRQAMKGGKPVSGMMPLMQEGQPPAWTSYVSVADAAATAAKVSEAGGSVIAEPMEVLDLGSMAVFADPTGAVFGIWQPTTSRSRTPTPRSSRPNRAAAASWSHRWRSRRVASRSSSTRTARASR